MSIIIAVLVDDRLGNKDIVFASDGRSIEHGTTNIRGEDFDKVKKIGFKTCLGYVGGSAEFYLDVFDELSNRMKKMSLKDLISVSSKLKNTINDMLKNQRHAKVEEIYGPLIHQFILGGIDNRKIRMITLNSSNGFQISKHDLLKNQNVAIEIMGSNEKVQALAATLCKEKLGHKQSSEEIVNNLRFIISKVAEQTHEINNHVFVRRLSKEFDIENYIGYK